MALAVSTVLISYSFLVDPDSKYQSLPGWTRLLANMFTGTISHIVTNFNSYISCVSIKVQGESSELLTRSLGGTRISKSHRRACAIVGPGAMSPLAS